MSYPEPRYHGDGGEASATFRPHGAPPDITYASGGTADYLATGASTGGLFGLYRWNMSAEPSGPGPHFHRTMAESFYVLLGTVEDLRRPRVGRLHAGRLRARAAGRNPRVPQRVRRARLDAASTSRPGAPREGYFEGLARFATEGRPGPEALERVLRGARQLLALTRLRLVRRVPVTHSPPIVAAGWRVERCNSSTGRERSSDPAPSGSGRCSSSSSLPAP